jgi:hypothetical protein
LSPIDLSTTTDAWDALTHDLVHQWNWCAGVLYRTTGNDAEAIIRRARGMMLLVAVGLGVLIIRWAWRLGGPVAGSIAGVLFCFDPNLTAHASLVTNDVAFSLALLALVYALWLAGQRADWHRLVAVAVLCGVAVTTKFSGLLCGPMIVVTLAARAWLAQPWVVLGRSLVTRWQRLLAVIGICVGVGVVSYTVIWAVYLCRYAASPDPGGDFGWQPLILSTQTYELYARHPGMPVTELERATWHPSLLARGVFLARRHRLLPEAFLFGMLHVHMGALVHPALLMGQLSMVGWWYYFPLAMLFKTPLGTLAALVMAGVVGIGTLKRWWPNGEARWLAACLGLPIVVYGYAAMTSNLNLGLRHILPIYPPLFISVAFAGAAVWHWRPARVLVAVVLVGLMVESVGAFPDYIPFFNVAAGGKRGGIKLLADSNLDWGQDLKLLSAWQRRHPDTKLYLLYFGTADPSYYNIRYTLMPGYPFSPPSEPVNTPGVIAISAFYLSLINATLLHLHAPIDLGPLREAYQWTRDAEPLDVLGGSIYLFPYPYHGPLRQTNGDATTD